MTREEKIEHLIKFHDAPGTLRGSRTITDFILDDIHDQKHEEINSYREGRLQDALETGAYI
jgi:hypothetical protein